MNQALLILGGLGVFLFGLRVMSQGLQKMAGGRLRAILGSLTRNRGAGLLSGFIITAVVQSSSATTVLIVSFVNASLLNLSQAIGLVMGANIGTTITAWLVALLGFKVKISAFALPIIGIGFPLSLINSSKAKNISEVMVGFGLLFMGLKFLKDGVPTTDAESFEWMRQVSDLGYLSVVLFVIGGTVITFVVQSSSAATAIVLTMVAKGWIDFELAAAMVLGTNIGTTITAQLAAIGANRAARRVAHFHTLFNLVGVIIFAPFLTPLLHIIEAILPGGPTASALVATSQVAAFHTVFNVLTTGVLVGFVSRLERIVMWLLPLRADESEGSHLAFLESGLMGTPELATVEARRALQQMMGACDCMFEKLAEVIRHPDTKLGNLVDEIKREEQRTDDMEQELIVFCSQLARAGTSQEVGNDVARYLEIANDVERIGDHCMNLVLLAERRWDRKLRFDEESQANLSEMLDTVAEFMALTLASLGPGSASNLGEAKVLEAKVNKLRTACRKSHARRMQAGDLRVKEGLVFLDMMTNMEKIGDYCWNVNENLE